MREKRPTNDRPYVTDWLARLLIYLDLICVQLLIAAGLLFVDGEEEEGRQAVVIWVIINWCHAEKLLRGTSKRIFYCWLSNCLTSCVCVWTAVECRLCFLVNTGWQLMACLLITFLFSVFYFFLFLVFASFTNLCFQSIFLVFLKDWIRALTTAWYCV